MNNNTTTYTATYHNNYPTCNGRRVFDTDKGTKLTLHGQGMDADYTVINWHSSDDYGQTLETVTVKNSIWGTNPVEIYSTDEGETFTFECE
jgi:lipoate-protein ligase B